MIHQEISQPELFRAGSIYIGVLIQSLILLSPEIPLRSLLTTFGVSLLGFLPGKNESDYVLTKHFYYSISLFILFYSVGFKDKILKTIDEKTLFSYTIIFWYVVIKFWKPPLDNFLYVILLLISLAFSFASMLISLTKRSFKPIHFLIYVWYIIMLVFFSLTTYYKLNFENIVPAINNSFITFLVYGMLVLYTGAHTVYLLKLIPWPRKKVPYSEVLKKWKKYFNFLRNKFKDRQHSQLNLISILTILIILFISKEFLFTSINELTFINLLIILTPYLSSIKIKNSNPLAE